MPLVWHFYLETQNLSLEQVDRLFAGDKVLLHWRASMGERQGWFALEAVPSTENKNPGVSKAYFGWKKRRTVRKST